MKSCPNASFALQTYVDLNTWTVVCGPYVPYRFGVLGSLANKIIYIRANGLNEEGKTNITISYGE